MAEPLEQGLPLSVRFENPDIGRETRNITEWSIDSDWLVSTDEFSFVYAEPDAPDRIFGLECQPVTLTVGDAGQLAGRIDVTEIGRRGAAVACSGRDYIADLVECNVDPSLVIKDQMTLQAALKLAMSPVGINVVLGDAKVMRDVRSGRSARAKAPPDFLSLKLQDLQPDSEQGIYEWANRIVARHGATIQPTLRRNEINVVAPNYDQEALYQIRRTRNPGGANRVKEAYATRDFARFPTFTIIRGQGAGKDVSGKDADNTSASINSAGLTPETIEVSAFGRRKPKPHGDDADGYLYRLLSLHDRTATNKTQVNAAAFRAIWDRLKDTLLYTATLRGHQDPDTGAIYTPDTIIDVQDDVAGVREKLWIKQRKLSYDPRGGAETQITCWRIGALQLGASA